VKSPQRIPLGAVYFTTISGERYYSAVAHTPWGSIPGRAVVERCWYPFGGVEYSTADFSWITAPNAKLVCHTGSLPAGAIAAGHQLDDGCTYYAAVARSQWGALPAKAKDNYCWYPYNGMEHKTSDFDWIAIGNGF